MQVSIQAQRPSDPKATGLTNYFAFTFLISRCHWKYIERINHKGPNGIWTYGGPTARPLYTMGVWRRLHYKIWGNGSNKKLAQSNIMLGFERVPIRGDMGLWNLDQAVWSERPSTPTAKINITAKFPRVLIRHKNLAHYTRLSPKTTTRSLENRYSRYQIHRSSQVYCSLSVACLTVAH